MKHYVILRNKIQHYETYCNTCETLRNIMKHNVTLRKTLCNIMKHNVTL